jgi:lipopolysaccharide/colanic/teichoic acid biosynthesis glycosyltransferase
VNLATETDQPGEEASPSKGSLSFLQTDAQAGTAVRFPTTASFFWKGALDLTLVFLSIPIWLPVMLLITLWIKLTSPGPVFFRQRRIGYQGHEFHIFKFRTMKVNVETKTHEEYFHHLIEADCPMIKLDSAGDPRLIPGGSILRASGLDELPQVFNILQGEMSIVGPRPCTVTEFERYDDWQKERTHTPPGLTGFWQTHGKNHTTFSEMIAMDIYYSRNKSLALDLWIIAKTIPVLIGQLLETRRRSPLQVAVAPQSESPVETSLRR